MFIWVMLFIEIEKFDRHVLWLAGYHAHCALVPARHVATGVTRRHPWRYLGKMVCWIFDKPGTMHPAAQKALAWLSRLAKTLLLPL